MNIRKIKARTTNRGQSAYTVAEAMIGVCVLALMLVALLAGMSSGFSFTQLAREDLRATQIMLEKMEIIRLYSWDQLNGSNGFVIPTAFSNTYYPPGMGSASGITFNGTLSIVPANLTNAEYSTNMLQIQVAVNWQSGKAQRSRTMSTYVGQFGMQSYVYYQ